MFIRGLHDKYPCLPTDGTNGTSSGRLIEQFCFDNYCESSTSCLFAIMEIDKSFQLPILDGNTLEEIKVKLHDVYEDYASTMTTIKYWFNGRTFVFDEESPDRPIDGITEAMLNKIHDRRTRVMRGGGIMPGALLMKGRQMLRQQKNSRIIFISRMVTEKVLWPGFELSSLRHWNAG